MSSNFYLSLLCTLGVQPFSASDASPFESIESIESFESIESIVSITSITIQTVLEFGYLLTSN